MIELIRQNLKENKKRYNDVEKKLRKNLDNSIPIDHVGSTTIPNIYGENIIDITIGAIDNKQFDNIKHVLEQIGFVPSEKSKDEIYQFFSSIEGETSSGDVHIHLVIMNTERYSEFLILRDYLLINKDEAREYSKFKKKNLYLGAEDRREYKRMKSQYVTDLLKRARESLNRRD